MNTYEIRFKRKFTFIQSRCNNLIYELAKFATVAIIDILSMNISSTVCCITVKCNKSLLDKYIDYICDKFEDEIKRVEIVEK